MKVVILCGGLGTRLREETEFRPKPMVPIGEMPILWHIMKTYSFYGHKEFILCLGYKGDVIKDFFRNYQWNSSDVTLKLGASPEIRYHNRHDEDDWTVTLVDTGARTMTGGRLQRALKHLNNETFLLTYGDGVTDANINETIAFHQQHNKKVTLTAVSTAGRFGELAFHGDAVRSFQEKPEREQGYINGGFFVMNHSIADYLTGDDCILERDPLERLAKEGELMAYRHDGYWQCMDTYREQQMLTELWEKGKAKWKLW